MAMCPICKLSLGDTDVEEILVTGKTTKLYAHKSCLAPWEAIVLHIIRKANQINL